MPKTLKSKSKSKSKKGGFVKTLKNKVINYTNKYQLNSYLTKIKRNNKKSQITKNEKYEMYESPKNELIKIIQDKNIKL